MFQSYDWPHVTSLLPYKGRPCAFSTFLVCVNLSVCVFVRLSVCFSVFIIFYTFFCRVRKRILIGRRLLGAKFAIFPIIYNIFIFFFFNAGFEPSSSLDESEHHDHYTNSSCTFNYYMCIDSLIKCANTCLYYIHVFVGLFARLPSIHFSLPLVCTTSDIHTCTYVRTLPLVAICLGLNFQIFQ